MFQKFRFSKCLEKILRMKRHIIWFFNHHCDIIATAILLQVSNKRFWYKSNLCKHCNNSNNMHNTPLSLIKCISLHHTNAHTAMVMVNDLLIREWWWFVYGLEQNHNILSFKTCYHPVTITTTFFHHWNAAFIVFLYTKVKQVET